MIAHGIVQLTVFSMPLTAYWLNLGLEQRAHDLDHSNNGGPYEAILPLGGLTNSTSHPQNPACHANLTEASDCAVQAANLWHQKLAHKIIVSGGAGPSDATKLPESRWMRDFSIDLGMARASIFEENQSTTTRENIRMSAELM